MDEDSLNVVIRPFHISDQAFIYCTWIDGLYFKNKGRRVNKTSFYRSTTRVIKDILDTAKIRIACLESDPDTIIGYCVMSDHHLDWIYVKIDYRGKGIGNLLLPKDIETVTEHQTTIGRAIAEKKNLKIRGDHGTSEESTT